MMMYLKSNKYLMMIFALGCLYSLLYINTQILLIDSEQLLERGYMFTQGILIPFGPRSTHTNLVYGPFIAIFTGVFLWIKNTPSTLLYGIGLFHVLGFWISTRIKLLQSSPTFYLIYLFLLWCSPWRANEVFIWNPCFIITLSLLYFYSLDLFNRNFLWQGTLLQGIVLMTCLQVHNSVLFLIILSCILWYRKIIKPHFGAALACVLVAVVFFAPTFIVIKNNPAILAHNKSAEAYLFRNLIHVGEAIKGVLYWVRYPSLYFGAPLMKISFFQNQFFSYLWKGVEWTVAILSLLAVAWANYLYYKKDQATSVLKKISVSAIMALVVTSCLSPVSFNYWHLYLIYPFALIPCAQILAVSKYQKVIIRGLVSYFSIFVLVSALGSKEHSWNYSADTQYLENFKTFQENCLKKYAGMGINFTQW